MLKTDWLRGVKRTPEEFDALVLRIVRAQPDLQFTARELSSRLAQFNGQMVPDVNRVLRSMKRLAKADNVQLGWYRRGWFFYYHVRYKHD